MRTQVRCVCLLINHLQNASGNVAESGFSGNNLFSYDGDMTIPEGEKYDIIQGCFEKSNVDANKEITSLMETQRLFEASSAVLKYMDTINGRAASEIIKL